jgi:hypothetical protein
VRGERQEDLPSHPPKRTNGARTAAATTAATKNTTRRTAGKLRAIKLKFNAGNAQKKKGVEMFSVEVGVFEVRREAYSYNDKDSARGAQLWTWCTPGPCS